MMWMPLSRPPQDNQRVLWLKRTHHIGGQQDGQFTFRISALQFQKNMPDSFGVWMEGDHSVADDYVHGWWAYDVPWPAKLPPEAFAKGVPPRFKRVES